MSNRMNPDSEARPLNAAPGNEFDALMDELVAIDNQTAAAKGTTTKTTLRNGVIKVQRTTRK